ncbi:phosphate acyltransferase [Veillonella sp. R32]|uniref:phosphate acyltransferase n=1 Tax=Veillonella sp. R32 TaxID=2021312 RepID=UPI001389AEC1|nr:phosphate acyltransferase [Veillonella sp. R32]KAF1683147.1 phosphate butyryltransferase [Veillonella sp. R32]
MIKNFAELEAKLSGETVKRRIAVVWAAEEHTLTAVKHIVDKGLVIPVLIGNKLEIEKVAQKVGLDSQKFELIPADDEVKASELAAQLAKDGNVDGIMKGALETGVLMKVLVNKEKGIRSKSVMSLLAFMESPNYHKIFAVTDVGLLTYPTLEQKQGALENAVIAYRALGINNPKVAVLAAVEHVNPKMPDSVDAGELKELNKQGVIKDCIVEGPISYDLAMDPESKIIKKYDSPVAGDADILVVPDIVSGNLLAKSLTCTGGAKTCGIILGALVPLIITSRAATIEDKYMAIILSALIGKR